MSTYSMFCVFWQKQGVWWGGAQLQHLNGHNFGRSFSASQNMSRVSTYVDHSSLQYCFLHSLVYRGLPKITFLAKAEAVAEGGKNFCFAEHFTSNMSTTHLYDTVFYIHLSIAVFLFSNVKKKTNISLQKINLSLLSTFQKTRFLPLNEAK